MKTLREEPKQEREISCLNSEDYTIGNIDTNKNPASHVVEEVRRSFKPPGAGTPTTPAEKIEESLSEVQNSIREQQMMIEQDLQSS